MNTIVAVAIVSIVINPLLYRAMPAFERWVSRQPRLWRLLNAFARRPDGPDSAARGEPTALATHRAVVIGYGPTGRTLTRLLRDNGDRADGGRAQHGHGAAAARRRR